MTLLQVFTLGLSVGACILAVHAWLLAWRIRTGILQQLLLAREELLATHDSANHWAMVADGVNHDPRCANHFTGGDGERVCMRCQVEQLRAQLAKAQRVIDALDSGNAQLAQVALLQAQLDECMKQRDERVKFIPPGWHHSPGDF